MKEKYSGLRRALFCNEQEMHRFRQLLVNLVIATDIADADLKKLRDERWAKVFDSEIASSTDPDNDTIKQQEGSQTFNFSDEQSSHIGEIDIQQSDTDIARKATVIIEHLILASDVSHMMQHFQVYRKWNEMFFQECFNVYRAGRAQKHPALSWYAGELWFFDNYIIPLAGKLKDCGAFGVSSDEYLNFALENRKEWAENGEDIVADMVAKYCE